jgi:hypothetical protein
VAKFQKFDGRSKKLVPAHPPEWLVRAVQERGEWEGIRPLEGIVTAPVLRPDGSILQTEGYDPATGLIYVPPSNLVLSMPDRPTKDDAVRALTLLLEVIRDFPFDHDGHRAGWLSGLLTALARYTFSGPAPMHVVDGNMRGAGKGRSTDSIGLIVTGRPMPKTPYTSDNEEIGKKITSIALEGDSLVCFDNVAVPLGCQNLDAALTTTTWSERLLGGNKKPTLPLNVTWFANGNNIQLVADTARRALVMRLRSLVERPEERAGFLHPNLEAWILENRGRLLGAALTVLRAFWLAGRPKQNLKPWGSFEAWSNVVRDALVWTGQPDPGELRGGMATAADVETGAFDALVSGLRKLFPHEERFTVKQVLNRVSPAHRTVFKVPMVEDKDPAMAEAAEQVLTALDELCPGEVTAASVGRMLGKYRERPTGGLALYCRAYQGTQKWHVVAIGG